MASPADCRAQTPAAHLKGMKKILILISATLLLAGCNGQKASVTKNASSYYSSALGISFDYPSNWKISEDKSITISSPPTDDAGTNIQITIPAEGFDEYENINKHLIQSNKMYMQKTNIKTRNNEYPAREYGQHGGRYYLIQVGEHFVGVTSERYLNQKQEEGLNVILDSLSFRRD